MSVRLRLVFGIAALIFTAIPAPDSSAVSIAETQPAIARYRFTPGQELTFHTDWSIKYWLGERNSFWNYQVDAVVWVVRKNTDGSFRLVFRQRENSIKTANGVKTENKPSNSVFYADVFPSGRQLPMHRYLYGATPSMLFPPLPVTPDDLKTGWASAPQQFSYICKSIPTPSGFAFEAQVESPFNATLQETHTSKYTFDEGRGFIARFDDTLTRNSGVKGAGGGTTMLVAVRSMGADELKRVSDDSNTYFTANEAYESRMSAAKNMTLQEADSEVTNAGADLRGALANIQQPNLRAATDEALIAHDVYAKQVIATAADRSTRIGKPAPDFETTDMDGNKVRLSDFRGKVVVLDFWYRYCAWCGRAMPQLNELATDFAGQPVAILGMNTDHDPADARFVMKKFGLRYPTLKAENLSAQFGVEGFPTLIVIDANGVFKSVEVGYSPTLRQDLGDQIRKLLVQ